MKKNCLFCLMLCAAMVFTLLSATPALAAVDMQADAPALTVNTSIIGFAGEEWYVIGYDGSGIYSQSNTATLLLKSSNEYHPYGKTEFRRGSITQDKPDWTYYVNFYYEGSFNKPDDYDDSTLQKRMVAIANGFPGKELALINARTLMASSEIEMTGRDVADQKIWPLSYDELRGIDDPTVRSFGYTFWLRTPHITLFACLGSMDGSHSIYESPDTRY